MSDRVLELPARIASLAPRDLDRARRLVAATPPGATAIEWRLDLADERIPAAALMDLDPRPAIVTYRGIREGGAFDGSAEEYARLLAEAQGAGAIVDVEAGRGFLSGRGAALDRGRVILSAHFPFGLPSDWEDRLLAMLAAGPRAVKLVAGAADLRSSLEIAAIQKRQRDPAVSVFPMGSASAPGRVLAALFGGSLVYGSVGFPTAVGQLALSEMLGVYCIEEPRELEALFGIVGLEVAPAAQRPLPIARTGPPLPASPRC